MTQRLIFIAVDKLKGKNATIDIPLDQEIPVKLCKGCCFFKPNRIEETLSSSISCGKPRLLELSEILGEKS